MDNGVEVDHAMDHGNQRSLYLSDPDGNRVEIYYEMPGALEIFAGGRMDEDVHLPVSRPGEPLPGWLFEEWADPRQIRGGAHRDMAGPRRHPRRGTEPQ